MSLLDRSGVTRLTLAQGGARGMRIIATGMLVAMAAIFLIANRFDEAYPALGLRQGVRRGGDGRRAGRLVRGHRLVPPSARRADPAHRDHPAQQGPDRRHARHLPARQFPDPLGGRAADEPVRRRRRDRPLPAPTRPARAACAKARRGSPPTCSNRSIRSGSAEWSRARSRAGCRRSKSRRCSGKSLEAAIDRGAATCRSSTAIIIWAGKTLDANEGSDPRAWSRSAPAGSCSSPGSTTGWPTRSSTGCAG